MVAGNEDSKVIQETLEVKIASGIFNNRKVLVFGCTPYTRNIRECLRVYGIEIEAIIDNNKNKIGSECLGIKVLSPEGYFEKNDREVIVIIASKYEQEMISQLQKIGLNKEYIVTIEVLESSTKDDDSEECLLRKLEEVENGYIIYDKIRKKYSKAEIVFVCPYPGTGDIYMACSLLHGFCERENIKEYVFCVLGENCKRVAELFYIENIHIISQNEKELLLKAWEFYGTEIMCLKPLLHWGWRTKRFLHSDNHLQITFMEMFQYDVYENDYEVESSHPYIDRKSEFAKELFDELKIKKGKTVILAPYAGSFISEISKKEWLKIVDFLKNKGFDVCTIGYGDKEPLIDGTKLIQFPYKEAVNVLEYAGYFIAVRSGLCDIVCQAKAKMLIIYEKCFNASSYEYFGLKNMGLKEDVLEVEYESGSRDKFVEYVEKLVD